MKNKAVRVVGNAFHNIANGFNIITYSELIEQLNSKTKLGQVLIEQGVSEEQVFAVKDLLNEKNRDSSLDIKSYYDNEQRCDDFLTHKAKSYNTLISYPKKINQDTYQAQLMVDERCAELSDHVTGKHIQGMVLIEAARQMTLAVTEEYFLSKEFQGNSYFVTDSLETKFLKFVFPIPVSMNYRVIKKRGINMPLSFLVEIDFIQKGEITTQVKYGFSVFDKSYLKSREDDMVSQELVNE